MMPAKDKKDENSCSPASPAPSLQSARRKSRGEQINFRLPVNLPAISSFQKRKKHWRSPSNPVEFSMNCALVDRVAIRKDRQTIKECINSIESSQSIKMPHTTSIISSPIHTAIAPTTPLLPGSPCQSTQKGQQLNFKNNSKVATGNCSKLGPFNSTKSTEMTIIKSEPSSTIRESRTSTSESQRLHYYETMLLKGPQNSANKFKMVAELSISPIVSTGSSDYTSTRRHVFTFESSYCQADFSKESNFDSTSLAHGHIDPSESADQKDSTGKRKSVTFSRTSLLQVILRNPQDNSVAGIFVVKLELSDMPPESRTILRQKAYKSKCLSDPSEIDTAPDYLAKFIEIPLKRSYDPEAKRQRIILSGPIRVAFSFNRSNLRYTSARRSDSSAVEPVQKTRTILQFPCKDQKYFPLVTDTNVSINNHDRLRSNSLTTENATRSFQHGSLCL